MSGEIIQSSFQQSHEVEMLKVSESPSKRPHASIINSKMEQNSQLLQYKHQVESLQLALKHMKEDYEQKLTNEK